MKLLVLSALVAVALAQPVEFTEKDLQEWENFKVKFTRNYESLEEHDRKKIIFFNNLKKIQAHNAKYERDEVSFKLGVNQFSDWSEEERSGRFKVKTPAPDTTSVNVFDMPEDLDLPKSVDWRDYGIVTPVRDQGVDCYGAGWAFSAAGALEGQYFKKANNLIPLSPQNLIDCSALQGNEGCDRGWPDYAFNYIVDNKGLDTENSYPYEGVDGDCRYKSKSVGATMTKLVDIPANKEKKLMQAVAKIGPISACIDANHESFYLYGSGVYNETQCNKEVGFIDHCVLIVGYGTDEKGGDYWLVKNSWGTSWGMDGYIMMTRNNKNQCGIAAKAQYPVV